MYWISANVAAWIFRKRRELTSWLQWNDEKKEWHATFGEVGDVKVYSAVVK